MCDAIASQTVRKAAHLKPAFVHAADVEVAARKHATRTKTPNILIYLTDEEIFAFAAYQRNITAPGPIAQISKTT